MKYVEFNFKNFKGIRDLRLSLDDRVTTLVGLNESGKTTILEAMFCFAYGAENLDAIDARMALIRLPESWIPVSERGNFNDKVSISALVSLDESDQQRYAQYMKTLGVTLSSTPSLIRVTEEYSYNASLFGAKKMLWDLKVEGHTGKERNNRKYPASSFQWKAATSYLSARLPKIWYFADFLFDLPDYFFLEDEVVGLTAEEMGRQQFYRSTFQQILDRASSGATIATHIVGRLRSSEPNAARNLESLMHDMSREMTSTIFDAWNQVFHREVIGQSVKLSAYLRDGVPVMELKIEGVDGIYPLTERSLGFRWFFMFLLMTRYLDSSSTTNNRVIMLDEPASNLHSNAQAELLKSFEDLSETASIVYTTHSHHMINLRWLDNAYVVKNSAFDDLDSEAYYTQNAARRASISASKYRRFVADNPSSTSYFQPVLDLLEYRPSSLEIVPNAVLVEGKSDFFILKYFAEVIGPPSDVALMPGLGAGNLSALISLHIGWGKAFVAILDGDKQGTIERSRYEERFGPSVRDRLLILPEMLDDPNIVEIEDLFTARDKDLIINSVFDSEVGVPSEKKALLQAVMELYARKMPLIFEPMTLGKIRELMAKLEAKLSS